MLPHGSQVSPMQESTIDCAKSKLQSESTFTIKHMQPMKERYETGRGRGRQRGSQDGNINTQLYGNEA